MDNGSGESGQRQDPETKGQSCGAASEVTDQGRAADRDLDVGPTQVTTVTVTTTTVPSSVTSHQDSNKDKEISTTTEARSAEAATRPVPGLRVLPLRQRDLPRSFWTEPNRPPLASQPHPATGPLSSCTPALLAAYRGCEWNAYNADVAARLYGRPEHQAVGGGAVACGCQGRCFSLENLRDRQIHSVTAAELLQSTLRHGYPLHPKKRYTVPPDVYDVVGAAAAQRDYRQWFTAHSLSPRKPDFGYCHSTGPLRQTTACCTHSLSARHSDSSRQHPWTPGGYLTDGREVTGLWKPIPTRTSCHYPPRFHPLAGLTSRY